MNRSGAALQGSFGSLRRAAPLLCLVLALLCLGKGSWIYLKASLAQVLIERSWNRALEGKEGESLAPWPWADTFPVARLEVPRLRKVSFILSGSSGRTLAFGPGHVAGTASPGAPGNSVIGGHRDTHFFYLEDLRLGDEVRIEGPSGELRRFRVEDLAIVDHRDSRPLAPSDDRRLTLITCYPFDAPIPGGPLRWVVTAAGEPAQR